jgi:hypothetical protein
MEKYQTLDIEQNYMCSYHELISPNYGSRVTIHQQISRNLNTRVTSTKGTIFPKRVFSNTKISVSMLDELVKLGFGGIGRNPPNQMG